MMENEFKITLSNETEITISCRGIIAGLPDEDGGDLFDFKAMYNLLQGVCISTNIPIVEICSGVIYNPDILTQEADK